VGTFFFIPHPTIKQQVGPSVFPKAVGILMILVSGLYFIQQMIGLAKEADEKRAAIIGAEEKVETKADIKTMGIMLAVMVAYALLFTPLGYALSTSPSWSASWSWTASISSATPSSPSSGASGCTSCSPWCSGSSFRRAP
jgi:hypothetical protein